MTSLHIYNILSITVGCVDLCFAHWPLLTLWPIFFTVANRHLSVCSTLTDIGRKVNCHFQNLCGINHAWPKNQWPSFLKFLNAFCFNNFQNNINGRKNVLQKYLFLRSQLILDTTDLSQNRILLNTSSNKIQSGLYIILCILYWLHENISAFSNL